MRLILGECGGVRSPVDTRSAMFYADALLESDARLALDFRYQERAAYVAEGTIEHDGKRYGAGQLLVFRAGDDVRLGAPEKARVASSKARLARAADDERIPLPDDAPNVADYP